MEEKLVELFKIANEVNEKQDKIYLRIEYTADETKKLEISVVNKSTYSLVEKVSIMLLFEPVEKLEAIIKLVSKHAGGVSYE